MTDDSSTPAADSAAEPAADSAAEPAAEPAPVPTPGDGGDVELLALIDRLANLLDRSDLSEIEVR